MSKTDREIVDQDSSSKLLSWSTRQKHKAFGTKKPHAMYMYILLLGMYVLRYIGQGEVGS